MADIVLQVVQSTIKANIGLQAVGPAGGDLAGAFPNPTIKVGAVTDAKASLATKPIVRVVATANVAALTGTTTIDGVVLVAGDLVLLVAQTTTSQNGPWTITAGAWTRPAWWPTAGTTQAFAGVDCYVREGTANSGSLWYVTTAGAITIDTTGVALVQSKQALGSLAPIAASSMLGNSTGAPATPTALSVSAVQTLLGILGLAASAITGVLTFTKLGTTARTITVQDKAGTMALVDQDPTASFKNKLLNYDFSLSQLGTSFTAVGYTLDQWYLNFTGTAPTLTQQTRTLGTLARPGKKFLRLVTVAGTLTPTVENRVEFVENFAGDTVTVSVTGKAGASRSVTVNLIQRFGTGGSPSADVTTAVGTINLTTSLARTSVTIAIPSISAKTLGTAGDYVAIQLAFPTATAETYDIYDVQAERGTLMTDLEQRPYEVELIECLRFLPSVPPAAATQYVGNGINNGATASIISIPLSPTPRAIPTGVIVTGTPKVNEITGSVATTSVIFNTGGYSAALVSAAVAAGLTVNRPTVLELPASASLVFTGCQL